MKKFLTALAFTLFSLPTLAQEFREGVHYDVISPAVSTRSGDKIEVVEFFAYSCGHCYNFEPLLTQWKKQQSDDVVLVPSPAVWSAPMEPHAKAFYAAEALGVLDTLHGALFAAMHIDRNRLASEDEIRKIFVANGVSAEDFNKAYRSFGVGSQVRQAGARAKGARISGTPEMMVAGKYRITTRKAGSQANMLKIADYLVALERAAAGGNSASAE
ncbi:MAG: thiol:disulfide interchange protein DsbA/DsbL [Halieaceae bacterium]|nr:thiol:disulfide interchange protein DsbA/DsbL [Halieaceae bacterium]